MRAVTIYVLYIHVVLRGRDCGGIVCSRVRVTRMRRREGDIVILPQNPNAMVFDIGTYIHTGLRGVGSGT